MPNHKSTTFDIEWLRNASRPPSPTDVASTSHRNVRLWNGNEFSKEGLNFIPYPAFLNGDALDHAVTELMKWGLIFIDGVPEDEESVANIAEKIGPLKNTFYGRTWDVRDKPKAENVAYTSHHLGLHMDLL
jgi:gamma-butyrobetaine dioxygenase